MSFRYISDLFGKLRKGRTTRFSGIERRTKALFNKIIDGEISYDEFYSQFQEISNAFAELRGNVIDEDTPLWLNSFCAFVFLKWCSWHLLRVMHRDNPKKFNTPELEQRYQEIVGMRYDEWLKDKIRTCLKEL